MKKKKIPLIIASHKVLLWFFLFVLYRANVDAQNFKYPETLASVSFSGDPQINYVPVQKDDNSGRFLAPQYVQQPYSTLPVAYVSGTTVKASATLKFTCSGRGSLPTTIWVKGTHQALDANDMNINFLPVQKPFATGTNMNFDTEADLPFTFKKVRFYESNFKILWEYTFTNPAQGNAKWIKAGESTNTLYVTLRTPKDENPAAVYMWFQTLLHHACKNAKGEQTELGVYQKVRDYYKSRAVKRADGVPLVYYLTWDCVNTSTASLITTGNGQCGSFAHTFLDVLKTQGVQESGNYVRIVPSDMSHGFYVKKWTNISGLGSSGDPTYKYLNIWKTTVYGNPYPPSGGYLWYESSNPIYPEVSESSPLPGQNNNAPLSRFGNHQFVYAFSEFFDTSYGVVYADDVAMDAAISHFIKLQSNPLPIGSTQADFVRKNPAGIQINKIISSY